MENQIQQAPSSQPVPTPPVQTETPVPVTVSKSNKPLVLLLVVLGLILVSGAIFVGIKIGRKQTQPISVQPTTSPTISPSTDPTSNWKTYSNSEFSFQYPPEYVLDNNIKSLITSKDKTVQIYAISTGEPMYNECMKLDETKTVNGLMIKRHSEVTTGEMCGGHDGNQRENWIVKAEGKGYAPGIQFIYSSKNGVQAEKVFDQILSTFRFTK